MIEHDWRSSGLINVSVTAPGPTVMPVNPDQIAPPTGPPYFVFDSRALLTVAATLYDVVPRIPLTKIARVKRHTQFPYRESTGVSSHTRLELAMLTRRA